MVLATEDEAKAPMGNIAAARIGDVLNAWLVGLQAEIAPVLPRVLEWLDRAIREDEDFGASRIFHRLTLNWAKSLGAWMKSGTNTAADWDRVREHSAATSEEPGNYAPEDIATDWLDDYMAFCFQADQWEPGIAAYEKRHGVRSVHLGKKLAPRDLGYALCLHKARGSFDAAELFEAGRRMLQAKLEDDWLGRGQTIRGATWLKVVYGHHDPALSPLQTILRAYENMPKVPAPEFLRA
ncbi:MAG TPA: hypothetical protein VGO61_17880 [Steroidobacteraceae bacterium]|nr:hypothetical protein [Steroidobacteraceae bacterium]